MKRNAVVSIGGFARRALAGENGDSFEHVSSRAERAVRAYLGDKGEERPGWKVPAFAQSAEPAEQAELRISLDEDLWAAVESEAAAQGVSVDQLIGHAVLYFAADLDAGRITQRIVEGFDHLDDEEED